MWCLGSMSLRSTSITRTSTTRSTGPASSRSGTVHESPHQLAHLAYAPTHQRTHAPTHTPTHPRTHARTHPHTHTRSTHGRTDAPTHSHTPTHGRVACAHPILHLDWLGACQAAARTTWKLVEGRLVASPRPLPHAPRPVPRALHSTNLSGRGDRLPSVHRLDIIDVKELDQWFDEDVFPEAAEPEASASAVNKTREGLGFACFRPLTYTHAPWGSVARANAQTESS